MAALGVFNTANRRCTSPNQGKNMDIVEPTAGLEQRTNSMTAMEKKSQWLVMAGNSRSLTHARSSSLGTVLAVALDQMPFGKSCRERISATERRFRPKDAASFYSCGNAVPRLDSLLASPFLLLSHSSIFFHDYWSKPVKHRT